jgi:2-polyprenyl-3-methyl-5-hydroxy-6-metoxy-1,4-benzoquinol methylase
MVLDLVKDVIAERNRDALAGQLLQSATAFWDVITVYLGDQLGLYQGLAAIEPATSTELAGRTGTHERYVREWLEHQTVAGILEVKNPEAGPLERRFALPEGHDQVLVDRDSLYYSAPMMQATIGSIAPLKALVGAFRTGDGIPYEAYGADMRDGIGELNRNLFLQVIPGEYLPSLTELDARLRARSGARVADIGVGVGWSSIGIATAYPNVIVDGFDVDEASVAAAKANVWSAGLEGRINIEWRDVADPTLTGRYDLVTAYLCVHDMSDPVGVLRSMRRLVADGGTVLVGDERTNDVFTPEGNELERLFYGFSITHCLPVGMADHPSAATGTVMRPPTLRKYAQEAGFQDIEILPIENFFWHFYRLLP